MRFAHQPSKYCDECRKFKPYTFDKIAPNGSVIGKASSCYYVPECQHIIKLMNHTMKIMDDKVKEGLLG